MKRFISIAIVCLLLLHFAGFYIYFIVRLGEIHIQMRHEFAKLPAESLDLIHVPRAEFMKSWLAEMEMKWEGKMYDIARVEFDGDVVKVFGRHDLAEEDLLSFVASVAQTASKDHQRVPNSVLRFFTLEFEALNKTSLAFSGANRFHHRSRYIKPQSLFEIPITTPPPRG